MTTTDTAAPTCSDGVWIGPMDRVLKAAALSPFVSQALLQTVAQHLGSPLARNEEEGEEAQEETIAGESLTARLTGDLQVLGLLPEDKPVVLIANKAEGKAGEAGALEPEDLGGE